MTIRRRLALLIGPLALILVGLLLLLRNLGVISASQWDALVGLWPLLVIAGAVGILLEGGSLFFPLALAAFALGFLAANYGLVAWNMWIVLGTLWPVLLVAIGLDVLVLWRRGGTETHTEELFQSAEGATSAEVKLEPGIGRLRLAASTTSDALVSGLAVLGPKEHVSQAIRWSGGQARITIKHHVPWLYFFAGPWLSERQWSLNLNPAVPTRLKIGGGLWDRTIDLRSLMLTRLEVDGGLGALTLVLPAHGQLQAKVDGGIGDKIILIPTGVAVRIRIDGGLGHRQVSGDLSREDDTYTSPGYGAAENQIDLDIDHGIGSLTVGAIG
jgi:hypothetical protein